MVVNRSANSLIIFGLVQKIVKKSGMALVMIESVSDLESVSRRSGWSYSSQLEVRKQSGD